MFAVLVLLASAATAHGQACSECTGDDCKVLETVKVTKLCANELCVNGSSVVVSDGNPCTSDDVINGVAVHLPIKNCCALDTDCAQWAPSPNCVLSHCALSEAVPTHGFCEFTAVPDCCAEEKDCPERACQTVTCVPTEVGSLHYSDQHKRFVELCDVQLNNIPGQCVYEQDANCCLTSRDCVNKCPPGTFGICDKGMDCVCVPSTDNECTVDEDCATDEAAKRTCEEGCEDETKPPCYYYECDRGWCTCVFDPDRDYDGDGVCCKNDCDDRDPDSQEQILCPASNETMPDADGDGFYLCGIVVEPTCNATCAGGLAPVAPEDVVEINGKLTIKYNCDCCDDNPAGLDQPLTCAKDANNNTVNAPPEDCVSNVFFVCDVCYEELCVLQPASGKVPINDTATLDQLCEDALGDDYEFYPVPAMPGDGRCDFCDDVVNPVSLTPTLLCPLEYDIDNETFTVCPQLIDGSSTGTEIGPCCEYILTTDADADNVHPELAKLKQCCQNLKDANYEAPCGSCLNGPTTLFPAVCNQCKCENEWPSPCNAVANPDTDAIIVCVNDTDGDHYFNCTDTHTSCFSDPSSQLSTDQKCALKFGETFVSLQTATGGQDISGGNFDNTFCDCNDTLVNVHQLIVCGVDNDDDGFLQCAEPTCQDGSYVARAPVCVRVCAAECAGDNVPITSNNCEPVGPPVRRRNNAATTLETIKAVAARHGWFDEAAGAASRKRQVQDDEVPPRQDPVCDDLVCNNCDCCDTDSFAFPLSPFGTAEPNACGNYDMNCDCMYHSTVACPNAVSELAPEHYYRLSDALGAAPDDADDFSVGIRNLGSAVSPKYTADVPLGITATPDRLGYCGDDCDTMCMNYTTGISLESQFGGPVNRKKRAISINLQKSCTELVDFDDADLDVNDDIATILPGKCFEFIEACSTPCNSDGECNPDCEICTKLWS